jgi:hypothetical protein
MPDSLAGFNSCINYIASNDVFGPM